MEQAQIEHAPNGSLQRYIISADVLVNKDVVLGVFDCCNCINSTKYSPNFVKNMALYFDTISQATCMISLISIIGKQNF